MQQNKNALHLYRDFRKLKMLLEGGAVFCAFDTETTGLHASSDFLIELGACKFNKDGIISTFNQLIKPPVLIPELVTSITNISDKTVENSPTEDKVLPHFLNFIQGTYLIAHNAPFDLYFVNTALERLSYSPLKNQTIDTLPLSRWVYPKFGKYKLQFLAQKLNINVENAHRASDDARVCMEVFLHCVKDTDHLQKKNPIK